MSTAAFDHAFKVINALSADFHKHRDGYMRSEYQEAEVRKDFIDKFFKALGWDVDHDRQPNPFEQEVKVEKTQMQQGARSQRFADYAFYLAPEFSVEKFFVEAKKPSVDLKNVDHYFQTIRYGWNAGCPVSVLTDFEQFHILDCRFKPDLRYVFNGHHKEYSYADYQDQDKFSEIYWLFSREAVAAGNIDRYAAQMPKPKGKVVQKALFRGTYQSIDDSFLEYIDGVREELARAFKKANPELDSWQLTEATQKAIDRLVFIRFLEDKGIEPNDIVSRWSERGKSAWKGFIADSRQMDVKYNGVVFKKHFIDDSDFLGADEKLFADICSEVSALNTPYNFNYIPIHILGSIYERFLGKVVVATDKRVRIEEKPEVRKAGGVYYTPKYIVDYIVDNTIGKQIEGKAPKEIAEMHFADIACGSGSFLIGVYDCLLKYHSKYYAEKYKGRIDPIDKRNEDFGKVERRDGVWILTLKQKQEILTNNIYGVDIDHQAVEVTQLSLFLKMLEDESLSSTMKREWTLMGKVLPDLTKNIVCGNSLIGNDIESGELFDLEVLQKINPFDYEVAFPMIMRGGGFDAIVGNPPYRLVQPNDTEATILNYYRDNYTRAEFKLDLFHLFVQKAIRSIKPKGLLGYIIPSSLLNNVYVENLRKWVMEKCLIKQIALTKEKVFADADVYTAVFLFENSTDKKSIAKNYIETATDLERVKENESPTYSKVLQTRFNNIEGTVWNILISESNAPLLQKINSETDTLGSITTINRGLITGDKTKFFSDRKLTDKHVPILAGGDVFRYYSNPTSQFVLFERTKAAGGCWDREVHFAPHKILIRQIGFEPTATLITEPIAVTGNIFTIRGKSLDDEKYILAIINSKLVKYFWKIMFTDFKNSFPQVTIFSLNSIPIKSRCDTSTKKKIVSFVDQLLKSKLHLLTVQTDRDKAILENRCAMLEHQLDSLVYDAYGLDKEEIKMVEGSGK